MIKASDYEALRAFILSRDVTITIEADGHKKTFQESNCSKAVATAGRSQEIQYLLEKRMIELAREILHATGDLDLSQ